MGIGSNILGALGLGADVNKAKGKTSDEETEGVVSELLPELTLDISNDDLIKLTDKWEENWNTSPVKSDWLKLADENEKYWKGKQFTKISNAEGERALQDNIVFEGTETFLPAATRQNPEPLVELKAVEKKDEANLKFAEIIRNRLADWADETKLRLKIKKAGRHWFISLLGVGKMGWDLTNNQPALRIIRAKKMILDPDGVSDEDGYSGEYAGEYRKMKASSLIAILKDNGEPDAVKAVTDEVKNELGTKVQFQEWWTTDYWCWKMGKHILLKKKNPHWNYDEVEEKPVGQVAPEADQNMPKMDTPAESTLSPSTEGQSTTAESTPVVPSPFLPDTTPKPPAQNHFSSRKIPYVFLTIFNLGKTPVDENSLITQTLPQQDVVNKRLKQIDANADDMNTGMVISETRSGLTKDEAAQVGKALRKKGTVVIPDGNPNEAVARFPASPLPTDVYNNMADQRNRFMGILGITGMSPAGVKNEDTVRGKLIVRGLDTDRIGGGVTEYFEQFADDIFNWVVQLYYVYDDIFANARGAVLPKIKVSVKEGSLLPKDATTKANQAIELASAGKMSLVDLYKALEYPDPEEMAANVWLEINAPWILFKDDERVKEVMQAMQNSKKSEEKPPSESISFKDLPPEGKVQMAKQAGIVLQPGEIEAEEAKKDAKEDRSKLIDASLKAKDKPKDDAVQK